MLLSVAIIVKNEEQLIERCCRCVSQFADEIVIVDTGSTDRTKELAAAFPKVKLFDSDFFTKETHYGDFSFSVAKNEAIARCTGDWAIWWDADDFIDEAGGASIRKIAAENVGASLYTFTISYGGLRFEHCRLFKNGYGIKFDENYSCHEFLGTGGHPLYHRRDIVIQHLPGKKEVASNPRNTAILEKDYFERGRQDPRNTFYLANSYRECGRLDDAVKFYDKYLEIAWWVEEMFFARLYKANTLIQQGKLVDGRNAALDCIKQDYRFAEPYMLLGEICFSQQDYARAIRWFQLALSTPYPTDARLFVNEAAYESHPTQRIDDCRKAMAGGVALPAQEELPKTAPPQGPETRKYLLPTERQEAIEALSALASCASENVHIEVCPADEWQKELVDAAKDVSVAGDTDNAMALELPDNLGSRHVIDWYCRSAGFLPKKWSVVDLDENKAPKGAVEIIRRITNAS